MKQYMTCTVVNDRIHDSFTENEKGGWVMVGHRIGKNTTFSIWSKDVVESPKPDWVKEELSEMRPPKSTLEQAYWAGGRDQQRWNFINQVPEYGTSRFLDWLETVPKDPLKEDRELVKRYLSHEFWMGNGYLTIQVESFTESVALSKALKRLCGLEVGNG